MPRRARTLIPGGIYHVTGRGNGRARIFDDQADYSRFMRGLEHVITDLAWDCLTYCLMPNHYHLLVRTPDADLPTGMGWLTAGYARYFNDHRGRSGHVFEDRYHDRLVVSEAHLLASLRYIARNPVTAGLCTSPEDWPWSGHRALIGQRTRSVVNRRRALEAFGTDPADAARRYRELTAEPSQDGIDDIDARILDDLLGKEPATDAIRAAHRLHGYSLRAIAAHLGCHHVTLRRRLAA